RLGEAASHFSRSAGVGDPEAVEALCEALAQAERRDAYEETLAILDALVEILPAGDDRWIRVAEAMAAEGDWAPHHAADLHGGTAIRAMREIRAALERTDDIRRRAAVTLRLSSMLAWGAHEFEEAERGCRDAAELFEQGGESAQMLLAVNELASIHGLRGDLAAWQEGARRVVEDAEATGHPFVVKRAAAALGMAAWWRGRFTDAEAAFRRCIEVAQTEGNLRRLAWALLSLAMTLAGEGRAAEATDLLERAAMMTPARRDSSLLELEASIHFLLGDYPAAVAAARDAAALTPSASRGDAVGIAAGAISAIETDQVAEARRQVTRCWSACGERPWFFYAAFCAMANGLLDWREGRLEEALASMQGAVSGLTSWRALPTLALALVELVEVAVEVGDVEAAGGGVAQLEAAADEMDRDLHRALAAIGRAWWRLAAGVRDAAAEEARRAVALLSDAGYHAFLARALDLLGRALAATDPAAAREAFDRAEEEFGVAGARWRLERMLKARRELGMV
ncbi:MAG TPA: tetratricopeptide repeat protein, partial [Candidatus Dormibacteraeota bacterium]|nr:tetratricopeptide repeat protein [Candidatus Dormibacteraeota bacterium]